MHLGSNYLVYYQIIKSFSAPGFLSLVSRSGNDVVLQKWTIIFFLDTDSLSIAVFGYQPYLISSVVLL